jgi:phosphopantetheinyl transferase
MQLWTLKEAFVKALGTGISAGPGLKGFSIGRARTAATCALHRQRPCMPVQHTVLFRAG